MNLKRLADQLTVEEGVPKKTYRCSKGYLTGGIGHNLDAHPEEGYVAVGVPVPDDVRDAWFESDIQECIEKLDRHLSWWRGLDGVRQNAILNLCFNMGIGGLLTFKNTLAAFAAGDYDKAAAGLLNSQYARDVGPYRSGRVAGMIRSGMWPRDIKWSDA